MQSPQSCLLSTARAQPGLPWPRPAGSLGAQVPPEAVSKARRPPLPPLRARLPLSKVQHGRGEGRERLPSVKQGVQLHGAINDTVPLSAHPRDRSAAPARPALEKEQLPFPWPAAPQSRRRPLLPARPQRDPCPAPPGARQPGKRAPPALQATPLCAKPGRLWRRSSTPVCPTASAGDLAQPLLAPWEGLWQPTSPPRTDAPRLRLAGHRPAPRDIASLDAPEDCKQSSSASLPSSRRRKSPRTASRPPGLAHPLLL